MKVVIPQTELNLEKCNKIRKYPLIFYSTFNVLKKLRIEVSEGQATYLYIFNQPVKKLSYVLIKSKCGTELLLSSFEIL